MENKILAVVNGVDLTQRDMEATVSRFPRERQGYFFSEEGRKQLLDQMISFELLYNFAKDSGIENDEEYKLQLEIAKKELLTQAAINNLLAEVKVDDSEVEEYYKANQAMFKNEESVSARHILVDSIERAQEIKSKIGDGMSFEEAAKEYSSCPSKAEGGNLGSFTKGQMVPEFENVAFNSEVGVVSEPVQTQFGFHLIKVEVKNEADIKPLEQVSDMIKSKLLQERQNYKYMSFTEELKNKYKVEIV